MNIIYEGTPQFPFTTISLSRKNLDGLLFQLDAVGMETEKDSAMIVRHTGNGRVIVVAEENDVHYRGGGYDRR